MILKQLVDTTGVPRKRAEVVANAAGQCLGGCGAGRLRTLTVMAPKWLSPMAGPLYLP